MQTLRIVALSIFLAGCVNAQPPTSQPTTDAAVTKVSDHASVDEILDALDARGRDLKDFSADVSLTTTDTTLGEATKRSGTIVFQNAESGNARIHIIFDTLDDGQRIKKQKTEYLLLDEYLFDRNYTKKQEVKRQLRKKGEQINLLKLGEGPFPLPIGQPKSEVHAQFEVERIDQEPAGITPPPNSTHLRLTPRAGTRMARQFPTIDVWVDTTHHMPVRIEVPDKNLTSINTTDLTNVKINAGVAEDAFKLPAVPADWSRTEEEYRE